MLYNTLSLYSLHYLNQNKKVCLKQTARVTKSEVYKKVVPIISWIKILLPNLSFWKLMFSAENPSYNPPPCYRWTLQHPYNTDDIVSVWPDVVRRRQRARCRAGRRCGLPWTVRLPTQLSLRQGRADYCCC